MDFGGMKADALVQEHNRRAEAAGLPSISGWSKSKDKLVERIRAIPQPKQKDGLSEKYEVAVRSASISQADPIATASEKLLTAVAFEHDGRRWGIPYNMILTEVKRVFPDCQTTIACLRWYAVDLNKNGVRLPHRKRSKS